jgi:hypothetical protein
MRYDSLEVDGGLLIEAVAMVSDEKIGIVWLALIFHYFSEPGKPPVLPCLKFLESESTTMPNHYPTNNVS